MILTTKDLRAALRQSEMTIEQMEIALKDARKFAEWIECLGRTDCEIYKHELRACADVAIARIDNALELINAN